MNYNFYGWQTAAGKPVNDDFPGIDSPLTMYDYLSRIWCAQTCAPRLREGWSSDNITLGQCSITAFLVQDIFGGKVYGIPREGGNFHCYNDIGSCVFDLTSEQFGEEAASLVYENNPLQSRDVHFAKEEKRLRYELLRERLQRYCNLRSHYSEEEADRIYRIITPRGEYVTLDEMIKRVELRPGMFLGNDQDIKSLSHFIDGFIICKQMMNILPENEHHFGGMFREFILKEYSNSEYIDKIDTILPWYKMIQYMVSSDKEGLELFFRLYDKFSHEADN